MKQGILLFNLGGPSDLKDVKPFLFSLFSDPDILIGMSKPMRMAVAYLISRLKSRSSKEAYKQIGGGSPQLKWTQTQSQLLSLEIKRRLGLEVPIAIGMRAWNPKISEGVDALIREGVTEIIALPLFPHFSFTTTGSCQKELDRVLRSLQGNPPRLKSIDRWPDQASFIALLQKKIRESCQKVQDPKHAHVMLSAHSLPMKIVQRGDPYVQDVEKTVQALASEITFPWSLAYQSRNGPVPWLKPYVETEIPRLAVSGVRELVLAPISFVSDHIETLYELDILYTRLAEEHGITRVYRTRAFNDDPDFAQVLFELVQSHLAGA
jgi:protoporphyrin/coproporphyrin ferrochelatase